MCLASRRTSRRRGQTPESRPLLDRASGAKSQAQHPFGHHFALPGALHISAWFAARLKRWLLPAGRTLERMKLMSFPFPWLPCSDLSCQFAVTHRQNTRRAYPAESALITSHHHISPSHPITSLTQKQQQPISVFFVKVKSGGALCTRPLHFTEAHIVFSESGSHTAPVDEVWHASWRRQIFWRSQVFFSPS